MIRLILSDLSWRSSWLLLLLLLVLTERLASLEAVADSCKGFWLATLSKEPGADDMDISAWRLRSSLDF